MTITPEDIKAYIQQNLQCDYIDVIGDGQHFQAVIVSPTFRGKTRVAQHQLVYTTLGHRMQQQIHALSMKTLTPEEWANSDKK